MKKVDGKSGRPETVRNPAVAVVRPRCAARTALWAVLLLLVVAGVFWPAGGFDYINLDDHVYTRYNEWVNRGLSWEGVRYAFAGTRGIAIWFPLTMLSYMADAAVGGVSARAFHVSSILWHMLAALALFLLLLEIVTARSARPNSVPAQPSALTLICALGACFWAIHPQRLESVVWIASRKDLVSGFFAFLSLLFYLKSVRRSDMQRHVLPRAVDLGSREGQASACPLHIGCFYVLSMLCFALAVMGKPVVMTLPLGMLTLEALVYRRVTLKALVIPAVLALACAANAVYMQSGESAKHLVGVPLWNRVVTSFASVFYYVAAAVWPDRVAIFHPWPLRPEFGMIACGVVLCLGMAWLFVWSLQGFRFVLEGGRLSLVSVGGARRETGFDAALLVLFFVGALFPMLNVFMFGHHARADRFTYYPSVALAIAPTLTLARLLSRLGNADAPTRVPPGEGHASACPSWPSPSPLPLLAVFAFLAAYGARTVSEMRHWRNTVAVFSRADEVTRDNAFAACRLGENYMQQGDGEKAERYFRKSIAIRPNDDNLGGLAIHLALTVRDDNYDEAFALAQQALTFDPQCIPANDALGYIAMRRQAWAPAEGYLRKVVGRKENSGESYEWLGIVQYNQGKYQEAAESFRQSMVCNPQNQQVRARYEQTLRKLGRN